MPSSVTVRALLAREQLLLYARLASLTGKVLVAQLSVTFKLAHSGAAFEH